MSGLHLVGAVVAVGLFLFLAAALLLPERFE